MEDLARKYADMPSTLEEPPWHEWELQFIKKLIGIVRAPVETCGVACQCHKELAVLSKELEVQETKISACRKKPVDNNAEAKNFEAYAGEVV